LIANAPTIADSIENAGKVGDVVMDGMAELANGMVVNSYFNTMAGQEFGGKWAAMDTIPDAAM
jgi:putative heme iron utilization protein